MGKHFGNVNDLIARSDLAVVGAQATGTGRRRRGLTKGLFLMIEETQVKQSIEKVLRVPGKYREFRADVNEADRRFAIKEPLLALLLDLGIPHISRAGNLCFDENDLFNISLDLRLPCVHWRFMRLWPKFLDLARQNTGAAYEFTVRAACPKPGHAGPCDFRFNSKIKSTLKVDRVSHLVFQFRGSPISEEYDFGESIAPIITEACRLQFYRLPNELTYDMQFLNDSGLATCQSAALWLAQVASRHGIDARPAVGLFVSVPYSVMHVWLEIRAGDGWKHADPFFLNSLARWGMIQLSDWPLSRSPRSAFFHLVSGTVLDEPLVWHHDDWGYSDAIATKPVAGVVAR
jgi:hypothetical protein